MDESPEEVLKNFRFLLGIPTLPPFWSLGFHQSRYGYKNLEEFKNVYEQYKENKIPIDSMWVDIDVMDNFEIFTINNLNNLELILKMKYIKMEESLSLLLILNYLLKIKIVP